MPWNDSTPGWTPCPTDTKTERCKVTCRHTNDTNAEPTFKVLAASPERVKRFSPVGKLAVAKMYAEPSWEVRASNEELNLQNQVDLNGLATCRLADAFGRSLKRVQWCNTQWDLRNLSMVLIDALNLPCVTLPQDQLCQCLRGLQRNEILPAVWWKMLCTVLQDSARQLSSWWARKYCQSKHLTFLLTSSHKTNIPFLAGFPLSYSIATWHLDFDTRIKTVADPFMFKLPAGASRIKQTRR